MPIPVEQAVRQHGLVREALIFGHGKSQIGMLIIPAGSAENVDPRNIIKAVWPIIEEQNTHQPGYAQLSKEMIRVLNTGTVYPATDKGTIIRQAAYREFAAQIHDIYYDLETKSAGTKVLSKDEMKSFLCAEIIRLLRCDDISSIAEDTDLFSLGIDSLQSTRLRATLLTELEFNGNSVPQNVIFDFPSISTLADALIAIREGGRIDAESTISHMRRLVAAYSDFPRHVPVMSSTAPSTVVVTGATGSLGAHLVARLLNNNAVGKVVALVRSKSTEDAFKRVVKSMWTRGVWHNLSLAARRKLQCFRADLSLEDLGLETEAYDAITRGLVAVMHCAWSVNFNKQLSSFEKDCIAGARNLMLLGLAAKQPVPATFNFCSSVSTVARFSGVVPAAVPDFDAAQLMGYAHTAAA